MDITLRIAQLMKSISETQALIEGYTNTVNELKTRINDYNEELENDKAELLSLLTDDDPIKFDGLVTKRFHKPNVGYTNETDVLNWLKTNYSGMYIKSRTTESLDKNPLKKALKTDIELKEGLKPFILEGTTDYVVVTTEDNYKKLLEHIE